MKVLVYYQPNNIKKDVFEGTRVRHSIKSALQSIGINSTSVVIDEYDVAHLFSPEDEMIANQIVDKGIPLVVSALYSENDPYASFSEYRRTKNGKRIITLKAKSIRMLNKASLILVPNVESKNLLISNGIISPIEMALPTINVSRYVYYPEEEKEIFYRYFKEDRSKKIILASGEYINLDGINSFINAAKRNSDSVFYFFGEKAKPTRKLKKIIKKAPKNVRFQGLVPEDIYRSALQNALIYMAPSYSYTGTMSLVEAMASKCQIVIRKRANLLDFVEKIGRAHV